MNFLRQTLSAVLFALALALAAPATAQAPGCALGEGGLSATEPPVNRAHLFCGEVNRRDRGTGFHHRPGGESPSSARIARIVDRNEATGVYVADGVEIFDGDRWRAKRHISSFYPDACTPAEVVASVAHAAANAVCAYPNGKWRGLSAPAANAEGFCLGDDGSVLTLEGYWRSRERRIVRTAWPLVDPEPAPVSCR
ncbi:MAG: EndoU domain-containing protein [Marivibrio sp.]|uniref:EndoU domain-containing protein n=1 Tax=Marivibrio sp. TaxID=2039719 RepID=UPI0032F044A9